MASPFPSVASGEYNENKIDEVENGVGSQNNNGPVGDMDRDQSANFEDMADGQQDQVKSGFGFEDYVEMLPDATRDGPNQSGGLGHQLDASTYGSAENMTGHHQSTDEGLLYTEEEKREGGHEGEEEDEYEDPQEIIREFGRHPMMDRVQEALYNQLLQTYERVNEELRDKGADVKK